MPNDTKPQGKTAWERLSRRAFGPKDVQAGYPNPLGLKVGAAVRFDEPAYGDRPYQVTGVRHWDRRLADAALPPVTDYFLRAGDRRLLVRALPRDAAPGERQTHHLLVLAEDLRLGWGDEARAALAAFTDPTGELYNHRGTPDEEHWWRVNDLRRPYRVTTTTLTDLNKDAVVEADEVVTDPHTVWDFHRETDGDGGRYTEYLYAEFGGVYNPDTGEVDGRAGGDKVIVVYRGREVHPDRVLV